MKTASAATAQGRNSSTAETSMNTIEMISVAKGITLTYSDPNQSFVLVEDSIESLSPALAPDDTFNYSFQLSGPNLPNLNLIFNGDSYAIGSPSNGWTVNDAGQFQYLNQTSMIATIDVTGTDCTPPQIIIVGTVPTLPGDGDGDEQ